MPEQIQPDPVSALLSEFNTKLREIEEKQKLIKDRVLLIGENLVAIREDTIKEISELKNKSRNIEQEIKKIKNTISRLIELNNDFARKSELEIIKNQIKMFSPLEFARIQDVERIINKKLKNK